MTCEKFDLVVIGGGTGANGVARACSMAGWRVASVEELPYGGTCALRGCDPKKMLIAVTEAVDWTQRMTGRGLRPSQPQIDWADMLAFKRTFTDVMPDRIEGGLEKAGITTVRGTARFVERDVIAVGDRRLRAEYFHIATGARPVTLDIVGEELVLTSTQFLEQKELPARLLFVGGGFISFEFAHIARRAGARSVTIVHRGERPLGGFDPDLVGLLVARTRELGVAVSLQSRVVRVKQADGGLHVTLATADGEETVECDAVVHGAGRVANIDGLGLDVAGVTFGRGGIAVGDTMRSVSNPAVFAAGDCADTPAPNLTPVSAYEARIASKNLLAKSDDLHVDYPPIPSVVFTLPPVGRVGLLEHEAREQGIDVAVRFERTSRWYSSVRVADPNSAYKTLIDKQSGRIVGAHLMGPGTEEQLNLFAMAMKAGLTANQIKATMFAYPSYASDIGSMV